MVEIMEVEVIPSEMLVNDLGCVRTMELDGFTRRLKANTTEAVGKWGHHLTL